MTDTVHIAVVHAGMSGQSSTGRLAAAFDEALVDQARARGLDAEVTLIPLRGLAHAIIDNVLTGFPAAELARAQRAVAGADGLIALTPTYQASYSGLFKAFFDVLEADALRAKPVILGATGGTPRHSLVTDMAMRPLMTYMHADPVPTSVYAATEDWGAHATDSDGSGGLALKPRIRRATAELLDRLHPERLEAAGSRGLSEGPKGGEAAGTTIGILESGRGAQPRSEADTWPGFTDFETLLGGTE